jgi:hypothetical protein
LYHEALTAGLGPDRRRPAVIQLPSSLRNLEQTEESVRLLQADKDRDEDDLADVVDSFLALTLTSAGRGRAAASVALTALARHITRYQRCLCAYGTTCRPDGRPPTRPDSRHEHEPDAHDKPAGQSTRTRTGSSLFLQGVSRICW